MSDIDNIMGVETGGLDISDEALDARGWEEDDTQASPDITSDTNETEEDVDESEAVSEDSDNQESEEEVDEDEVVEESSEWEMPDKLRGKSAEEIAQIYTNLESMNTKQSEETQRAIQQLQQQNADLQQYVMMQQQSQQTHTSGDEIEALLDYAVDNPQGAYQEVLNAWGQGVASQDLVEAVIDEVYDVDERLARKMDRHFTRIAQEATVAYETEPLHENHQMQVLQRATVQLMRDNPDSVEYASEIGQIVNSNPEIFGDGSDESIANGVLHAYRLAVGSDPSKTAAYKTALARKLEAEKIDAQVEKGSPPEAGEAPKSEADLIREQAFGTNDPVKDIFEW